MSETTAKRRRDDAGDPQSDTPKRHRNPYIPDQQETTQELLDFFTNLPPDPFLAFTHEPEPDPNPKQDPAEDDDEKERVIRHLLEASDDELGIPSRVDDGGDGGGDGGGDVIGGDDDVTGWDLCDGLWEIEDEAANYYSLVQSGLFLQ